MTSDDRPGSRWSRGRFTWRRPIKPGGTWIRRHEALASLGLVAGYLTTFLVPRRLDPWLATRLTDLFMRIRRGNVARTESLITNRLGSWAASFDMAAVTRGYYSGKFEYAVGRVRGMHPRAWDPQIEVEGGEHVEAALREGRGAILWRMDCGDTMLLQHAAWEQGWPLVQLSSAVHGVSDSQFGLRVGGPLYARPENAYLTERVRVPADWSFGYLPRLIRALHGNQVVAILGEVVARQNVVVSVLGGTRPLPTGAPALAHRTGASLIPAATVRDGRWRYRLKLGPPIDVDRSLRRREATDLALAEFGRRMEAVLVEHPGDWNGWWRLHVPSEAEDASAAEPAP